MKSDAIFSDCRTYRYALWRLWDDSRPCAMFIGLNPSSADEAINDPTIRRCIAFSHDWGYGGLCMANLFAFRAITPGDLKAADQPIGSGNDDWIIRLVKKAGVVVAAWGNHGSYLGRSQDVRAMIPELMCLKINQSGEPAHPLYQPGLAHPMPWISSTGSMRIQRIEQASTCSSSSRCSAVRARASAAEP